MGQTRAEREAEEFDRVGQFDELIPRGFTPERDAALGRRSEEEDERAEQSYQPS